MALAGLARDSNGCSDNGAPPINGSVVQPPRKERTMSAGFNQVIVLGRLAAEPEELKTKSGKLFIKATIAVSVYRKNAEGVSEEHTSFLPVTIFGKIAETFLSYVCPGDMVHLAGRLDSNEWKADDGKKRLSLSFTVEQLNLLPNNRAGKPPDSAAPTSAPPFTLRPKQREAGK
jgi:single-strand DNA-binding protein